MYVMSYGADYIYSFEEKLIYRLAICINGWIYP